MKLGHLEVKPVKAAIIAAIYLACWTWPMIVRPVVLSHGKVQDAQVRTLKKQFLGLRCRVIAATKLGDKSVRFYAYASPSACDTLTHGSPIKLVLLKAGPVYWVQLADDFGFGHFQQALGVFLFVVITAGGLYALWRLTKPREKSASASDLRDLIRNL